jgi:hypothetical protein
MRLAILILLLLNLAFFAWARWIGGPQRAADVAERGPLVPRLRLASEPVTQPPPANPSITGEPPATGTKCVSLGPFADTTTADKANALLTQAGHQPRRRAVELVSGTQWWVSAQAPSDKEAQQWLKLLQARGIKDAVIVPADVAAPGAQPAVLIDLGVFDDQVRATQHAADITALGLKPQVSERPMILKAMWFDIDLAPGDHAVEPAAIAPAMGVSMLELQACPPPAPAATETPAPRPQTG